MLVKINYKQIEKAVQILKENGIEVDANPNLITEMFENELRFHIENGLYVIYEWNDNIIRDVAEKLMMDDYTIDNERMDQVIEEYFRGL